MLDRSGSAPLEMMIFSNKIKPNPIEDLGLHCRRCRTLYINYPLLSSILPQFDRSETLETLTVGRSGVYDPEPIPLGLQQTISNCPALRRLELTSCQVQWDRLQAAFPSLKALYLSGLRIHGEENLDSSPGLYESLSSMPLLEDLSLDDVLPSDLSSSTRLKPPLFLASMTYLSITETQAHPVALFFIHHLCPKHSDDSRRPRILGPAG